MIKPKYYQHLVSENTVNGNPRRLFVTYAADGRPVSVLDEGYAGTPTECHDLIELPTINIQPKEYKRILGWDGRAMKNKGVNHVKKV